MHADHEPSYTVGRLGGHLGERPGQNREVPAAEDAWVSRRLRLSWFLWALFALVIVVGKAGDGPGSGSVYSIYLASGGRFLTGAPLYPVLDFLYLPTAAAFFAPFDLLSYEVGAAVWRVVNLAVFGAGLFRLARMNRADGPRPDVLYAAGIVALLSVGGAKHGQMTLAMAGLLMFAAVDLERSRSWRAASCLVLAVAAKPIAVPFVLLAVLAYPAVRLRTVAVGAAVFLLPFLLQDPAYVLAQYADVPRMLAAASEREYERVMPSLFGLLQTMGFDLNGSGRLVVRTVLGLGALAAYVAGRARLSEPADRCLYFLGVAAGYTLLFSPGTERNTYALLAPVVGLSWSLAHVRGWRWAQLVLGLVVGAGLLSYSFSKTFPGTPLSMLKAVGAVLVVAYLVRDALLGVGRSAVGGAAGGPEVEALRD